jgi:hypothetical protein
MPSTTPVTETPQWKLDFLEATRAFELMLKSTHVDMLKDVTNELTEKFKQMAEETDKMRELRELLSLCDKSTNKEGILDLTALSGEKKAQVTKTLTDYDIKEADILEKTLDNFERELLIDSIKMKIENIDLPQKRLILQIQQSLYMRNESYLASKSNNKALDDPKRKMSSNIAQR